LPGGIGGVAEDIIRETNRLALRVGVGVLSPSRVTASEAAVFPVSVSPMSVLGGWAVDRGGTGAGGTSSILGASAGDWPCFE